MSNDITHVGYFSRAFRFNDLGVLMWLEGACLRLISGVVTFRRMEERIVTLFLKDCISICSKLASVMFWRSVSCVSMFIFEVLTVMEVKAAIFCDVTLPQ
jgi:hypothetical protein